MSVLLLGSDTPIGLTIIRELGRHGVPVYAIGRSANAIGGASRHVTRHGVRPQGPLADWLPGLIATLKPAALLAISENDLLDLARMDETIAGCRILTPRAAPLALALDKTATLALARTIGIATPDMWQPLPGDDFAAMAEAQHYPVVVKWANPPDAHARLAAHGLALEKAEFAADAGQLMAILARYAPLGQWPLVQRYCPGFGVGHMLLMRDGRATLRFQHRRLHEWPPEGGVSTLCVGQALTPDDPQMALSERLLAAMGWQGPAMVEYRYDPATGSHVLMEVNGRFWGSQPLASACGAEFAWHAYAQAILGQTLPPPAPNTLRKARYMVPETRRLLTVCTRRHFADPYFRPQRWRALWQYLAGFLDPNMSYYIFQWQDPGPFLRDTANILRKIARR